MNTIMFKRSLIALTINLLMSSCVGSGSNTQWLDGQNTTVLKKKYKTISIVPQTEYYLHGQLGAIWDANKKSRITFPIVLPENTVEWYYVFSASQQNSKNNFNLLGQLASIVDQTGSLNFGIDLLSTPPGSHVCNVFTFADYENSRFFQENKDFEYLVDCSRQNIKSGTVKVPGVPGFMGLKGGFKMYMGLDNPKDLKGISVSIEVVAIVLE